MNDSTSAPFVPTRIRPIALLLLALCLANSAGCAAGRRDLSEPLAFTPDEIMPMHDRDHYVYFWQRVTGGDVDGRGYHVEHVSILPEEHEFEVTVSEDGMPAGRLRFFHDGRRVELLSEDDLENGIRRSYDPPLVHLRAPLRAGESGSRSTASITHIGTGQLIARIGVSQRVRLSRASDIESDLGTFEEGVLMEARRTLHTPTGDIEMLSAAVLVPGVGEIRSEGATVAGESLSLENTPELDTVLRRELACAIVDNRAVGNCRDVEDRLRGHSRAVP